MMIEKLKLFIFSNLMVLISAALPPIEKCSLSDSACIRSSAQNIIPMFTAGIPELGTESLDPLLIEHIKVELAGLNLDMNNAELKGIKKAVIEKLSVDMSKKQIRLDFHSDLFMKSKYKASGRLLVLPINGDGDLIFKIKNILIQVTMLFEVSKNAEGKDVIEIKSHKYKFDIRENLHITLTNLFNGNKELSEPLHEFMNANWRTLVKEFGTPVVEKPIQKIVATIKTYLAAFPIEEITSA